MLSITKLKENFKISKQRPYHIYNDKYLELPLVEFIYKDDEIAVYRNETDVYVKIKKTTLKFKHITHLGTNKTINNVSRWCEKPDMKIVLNSQKCAFMHLEGVLLHSYKLALLKLSSQYINEQKTLIAIKKRKEIYIRSIQFDEYTDFIEQFESLMKITRDEELERQRKIEAKKKEFMLDPEKIKQSIAHLKNLPIETRLLRLKEKLKR